MATKSVNANKLAAHTLRHRAVCNSGDLSTPWRDTLTSAQSDATKHQREHEDHLIDIITEQTLRMAFRAELPQ